MDIEKIIARVTEETMARLASMKAGRSPAELAAAIEHSLLNPDFSADTIRKGCADAKQYGFANVCVSPYYVAMAADQLRGTGIAVCTVAGFPHAAASTSAKCAEIREAIRNGATEIDAAMMIVAAKSGDFEFVKKDLAEMVTVAAGRAKIKAIYEQGLYTDDEKKRVLEIAAQCGVDFVKISNALTGKKAMVEDVQFVRGIIGPKVGIKIDGGIKDAATANTILDSGANRIGCSASIQIVTGG